LLTTSTPVQVATGIVACWLSAGIVFGFAALKPVLIAEGVYSDLCHTSGERIDRYDMPCDKQDMALNLFFIVASVTANVSSLLAGSALDTYGRRACWIVGCICLTVGSLLMGTSFAIRQFDGYIVANVLLSLGGTFIFVPSFRLANAFPKYSGMIVALVTGAFDASAAVFLLYRLLYEATDGRFSIDTFFYGYTAVPALLVMAEFAYMPPSPYHNITELERKIDKAQDDSRDAHESDQEVEDMDELTMIQNARADRRLAKLSSIEDVAGNTDHREERRRIKVERQTTSGVWGVLHGLPAQKQMLTPWFSLILVLTTIQMMRMNYFIATIRAQYQFMLGSERPAGAINRFFDIALPVGGVASTPFIGVLLNNFSVPAVFATLTVFIAAIGVLNCLPYVWAGYATVVAFVIFRPLYYSAVS
jgi:MFS family permease